MTNNFNDNQRHRSWYIHLKKCVLSVREGKEPSLQVAKRYESVIEDLSNASNPTHDIRQMVLQSSYTPSSFS